MPNPPVAREWRLGVDCQHSRDLGGRDTGAQGLGLVANTGRPQESREFFELPGPLSLRSGAAPE